MPTRSNIDQHDLYLLAERQDSLVTLAQVEELGLSPSTAVKRTHGRGPWQRVLPGIVALHNGPLTNRQLMRATILFAGPESLLTGAAALGLIGFRRQLAVPPVHALVPDHRQRTSSGFALVERTIRMPNPTVRQGLPVAPPERAVFDAARRHRSPDDVRAMAAEALQRGFVTVDALARELREGQIRGSRLLRQAMPEVSAGIRSVAEGDARNLVAQRPRLAGMWWNPRVYAANGAFILMPDGWMDEIALAWQIDSLEFHLSPADYAKTLRSHTSATTEGIIVVHHLPSDVRRRPREVVHDMEAAVDVALARPRPDVYAVR